MPQARLSMRKIRETLRLKFDRRRTNREVATACNVSAATVWDTLKRFKESGLDWPLPEGMSDEELEFKLYPPKPESVDEKYVPDWALLHNERKKSKNVTLQLLWEEYIADHPHGYQYSWFCKHYKNWRKTVEPVMRQTYHFGEKCFVDYAGETMAVVDPRTGEVTDVQIFVGTLGASNYTYAEAQPSQKLEHWIGGQVRMFEYFGGVPEVLIPDNLKSGVKRPDFYDPDLNPTYQLMAEHYSVAVIPARVRKPRDKAKGENAVLQVERWVIAPLRNRTFYSLKELNEAISEKLDDLNERPFQKLPGCRRESFEKDELSVLRPLPSQRFSFVHRKDAKVGIDYHVQYDDHYYSVPYGLVGARVEVFARTAVIELVHGGRRVASHRRSYAKGGFTTDPAHRPPNHRHAEWNPERLKSWARKLGPNVELMIIGILAGYQYPAQGYRRCLGVLSMAKKYGSERLDRACRRGVELGAFSYRSVKSTLEKNLDQEPLTVTETVTTEVRRLHDNVRGATYYQ